ncbi:MAG: serine hydrolase [Oscillospiraceae bacterium]|nr:serine hydrolase [Oscillospiraceae bacterium]
MVFFKLKSEKLKSGLRKILSLSLSLMLVCLCCLPPVSSKAISFTPNFEINSAAGLLINLDTGNVLYEKNADAQYMPGSLVQIMEAVIVLENCQDIHMQITCDTELIQRYQQTEFPDDLRYADIYGDDVLTVEELLYAMLLTSSCEASVMLANQFGNGSVAGFVDMMNKKAQEIGCTQTTFTNVTGIYDPAQKTTANDMAKIMQYALSLSKFITYASAASFAPTTPNTDRHNMDEWIWTHSNTMLQENTDYYTPGVKGIKTANLNQQGRNIICQGTKDGTTYLVILLAAPFNDSDDNLKFYHLEDARQLLDWAFQDFTYQTVLSENTELGQINVQNGKDADYVLVKPAKSFMTLWYDGADSNAIQQEVRLEDNISAPVEEGQKLGTVTLRYSGEELTTIDLVATTGIALSKQKYYLALAKHFPETPWLTRAIFLSVLLCAIYLALCFYAQALHRQRAKTPEPVHLKPRAAAVKKEAAKQNAKSKNSKK